MRRYHHSIFKTHKKILCALQICIVIFVLVQVPQSILILLVNSCTVSRGTYFMAYLFYYNLTEQVIPENDINNDLCYKMSKFSYTLEQKIGFYTCWKEHF